MTCPAAPSPSSAGLRITHRDAPNGWCVVSVQGEVDLASAPALETALDELLPGQGSVRFVLDLSRVGYLDSTGLAVLHAFRRRLGSDGALKLAGLPANLLGVLRLSGLDRTFDICADDECVYGPPPSTGSDR